MKKRLLAFVFSVCLVVTLIPTAWAANKSYTINGTTVTAASGTAVGNCSTYASQVLRKIWTVGKATMTTYNSKYNLLKGKSAAERELTQVHTKEYIQQAPLGSRIRICASSDTTTNNYDSSSQGHTLVLVEKNSAAETFTVLHAGWGAAAAKTYTYQEFSDFWASKGYHYFFYIADYSAAATNRQDTGKTVISVASTLSGEWVIVIPADYRVLCYSVAGAVESSDYRKPREKAYTLICTQKATLSNGNTRYYYTTPDNRGLWFDFTSAMTVEDQNIHTVTFDANGTSGAFPIIQVKNGTTYNDLPTINRKGYIFEGWYTEKSGGSQITPNTTVNLKKDQTLYAHWTKKTEVCTVTFDANGGTVSKKTMQVPKGSTLDSLPTPTRSGYTFVCWSNTNGASGLTIKAGNYVVEQDVTLYAWWKKTETQSTGHWGPWSKWSSKSYTTSSTRQVETKQVQTVEAHMEYRYVRYVDQTGGHNCWCGKYLEGLSYISGKAKLDYSKWSTTRYSPSGSTWTCGQCNGKHTGVDHVDSAGRPIWAEYRLPGNKPYYWEETRTVGAQYETQYRYRDWIVD